MPPYITVTVTSMNAMRAMGTQLRQRSVEEQQLQYLFGAGVGAAGEAIYQLLRARGVDRAAGRLLQPRAEVVEPAAQLVPEPAANGRIEAAFLLFEELQFAAR